MLTGFGMAGRIAARFHNTEVFDRVVIALCQRTLLCPSPDGTIPEEVCDFDGMACSW